MTKAQTGGTASPIIGVVAVPAKRNYLRHLAPQTVEWEGWATRHVHTLCGWVGMAMESDDGERAGRDAQGWPIRRRNCQRCIARGES